MIQRLVTIFKALGEPTRLKIVKLVTVQELCVCELVAILEMSQPRVSQHLKVLKNAGIVMERKEGQKSFYKLNPEFGSGEIKDFLNYMTAQLEALSELADERQRLAQIDTNEAVIRCKNSP